MAISAREAARLYIKRGWKVLPIKHREKGCFVKGWQTLDVLEDQVDQFFSAGPQNIGVRLGEASGGLVDIDLDCPEAVALAKWFLPDTNAIFGRPGARASHWLYMCPLFTIQEKDTDQYVDPVKPAASVLPGPDGQIPVKPAEKKVIVEIRGGRNACQTVFPPSTHPSGELIDWEPRYTDKMAENEIGVVEDPNYLVFRVRQLAAVVLLVRWFPGPGSRNETMHKLGGFLARQGFSVDKVGKLCQLIASAVPGIERNDIDSGVRSAQNWHAGTKKNIAGIPAMKEIFGSEVIDRVVEWLLPEYNKDDPKGAHSKKDGFIRSGKKGDGPPKPGELKNVQRAFDKLEITIRRNEFSLNDEQTGMADLPTVIEDEFCAVVRGEMNDRWGFNPNENITWQAITIAAMRNRYHPVRDYFTDLHWDGVPRLETWLMDYTGATDTPFHRAIGKKWLVAAVHRVFEPGCKFDHMLVLEGKQDLGKSRLLRTLAIRDEWFTDQLKLDDETKVVIEKTCGTLIVEFAELSGLRGKKDLNHVKSLITSQFDRARGAYGRKPSTVPRQFIFAGTTNESDYLEDDENRRYWPVRVEKCDTEGLALIRDQLWAEAVQVYRRADEKLWLEDDSIKREAREAQGERRYRGELEDMLEHALHGRPGWISAAALWRVLNVEDTDTDARVRLRTALGRALKNLQFERGRVTNKAEEDLYRLPVHGVFYYRGNKTDMIDSDVEKQSRTGALAAYLKDWPKVKGADPEDLGTYYDPHKGECF